MANNRDAARSSRGALPVRRGESLCWFKFQTRNQSQFLARSGVGLCLQLSDRLLEALGEEVAFCPCRLRA